MKKLVMLATAAFLFSGIAFAQTDKKNDGKEKGTKECCKKEGNKCCKDKDAKCCKKTTTAEKKA